MKIFLICFSLLTIQAVFAQQETAKDTTKTTELMKLWFNLKRKVLSKKQIERYLIFQNKAI